jgi:hypothetical protein
MARLFDITTTDDRLKVDAKGQGQVAFTVTNTTPRRVRGRMKPKALEGGQSAWLTVSGAAERDFAPNATEQVSVQVSVPPGTAPGSFKLRLDGVAVDNPEEDFTEGPAIAVEIAGAPPPPKPSLWWVWVLVAVILVVVAVVAYLLLRKPKAPDVPPPRPPASAPVPPTPVTKEFNDPRVTVPQGNLALDVCRDWGTNCGKPAADAYCLAHGFVQASDFRVASDSPPTVVIASKQVCSEQFCDRISWVQCTGQRNAIVSINPSTQLYLQRMHLRGKQGPVPASSP